MHWWWLTLLVVIAAVLLVGLVRRVRLWIPAGGKMMRREAACPPPPAPGPTFQAHWPRNLAPAIWHPLWAYVYAGAAGWSGYQQDKRLRVDARVSRQREASLAFAHLLPGVELLIVPCAPGMDFNPTAVTLRWLEPWHCIEFRMRRSLIDGDSEVATGVISIYASGLLLGEIPLQLNFAREAGPADGTMTGAEARQYRRIFVSYSREDSDIVDMLERAYVALGDSYLRDIRILRSGDTWSDALFDAIDSADIFQLCWSTAASNSQNVTDEWRYALELRRGQFIRPVYWQTPLPPPPPKLAHLHFSYLPLTRA